MSRTLVHESTSLVEASKPHAAETTGPGRFKVRIISAGVGSSGVYPAEALKAAAEAKVFPAGTQMFLDHPSASEAWDRPERSVRDIAARLSSDAVYVNEDGGALDAEIEVFTPWRTTIAEMADTIGLSIRALAEVNENDEQGRPIVARIVEAQSVDFVTKAGRGGKILALVESARANVRAVQRGLSEASAEQRGGELRALVRAAYATGAREHAWIVDYDETARTVTFTHETEDGSRILRQAYELTDDVATALTGDPVEVRRVVAYVPVDEAATPQTADADQAPVSEAAPAAEPNPPAVEAGTTPPHKKEDPMGTIQVDEARYAGLEEKAALVPALDAKVEAAEARAVAAEQRALQAEAASKARDFARKLAAEANRDLVVASLNAIVDESTRNALPLDADGRLDTEKFGAVVNEARKAHETLLAAVAEASGVGTVRGVGQTTTTTTSVSEADADAAALAAFGIKKGA
ncbi:hypothetical protein Xcel_0537 [Xylanimonas cellulosilytica DSM 15894]|uniref:Capsid maturation protease n=1 Tax=Xylanimonas cellulosilytica (strain DSM 15894 / JCM 12276 / CECT 5975 / KCTC 9989 / LMG 20990 / NBRC 107835 / XIL07) TaxID=446471 RepID=D1BW73_XYLCX|nr:hypothetical protein [Xylanimonas cellulosilytica]ACZ29576.1 hypothetical protein Xcel_0537 [Xylanimonas cellulosilytica DSM 15894]